MLRSVWTNSNAATTRKVRNAWDESTIFSLCYQKSEFSQDDVLPIKTVCSSQKEDLRLEIIHLCSSVLITQAVESALKDAVYNRKKSWTGPTLSFRAHRT
jgi:hypothetical protein